jgi:hypothetical protein
MKSWRKAKDFVCPKCGKDFDKLSQIKRHCKDAHKSLYVSDKEVTKSNNEDGGMQCNKRM